MVGPSEQITSVRVVNEQEARELARRALASEDLAITGASRISKTWVVSHDTREYVDTGDDLYMLTGPGPLLVSEGGRLVRGPGTTRPTHTSRPETIAEAVAEFEQQHP
jgi:Immunity protein 35